MRNRDLDSKVFEALCRMESAQLRLEKARYVAMEAPSTWAETEVEKAQLAVIKAEEDYNSIYNLMKQNF